MAAVGIWSDLDLRLVFLLIPHRREAPRWPVGDCIIALPEHCLTFTCASSLLYELVGRVEELGDILGVHISKLEAQLPEPAGQLHVLWVVVDGNDPAGHAMLSLGCFRERTRYYRMQSYIFSHSISDR